MKMTYPNLAFAFASIVSGMLFLSPCASALTLADPSWTLNLSPGGLLSGSTPEDATVTTPNGHFSATGIVNLQPSPSISISATVVGTGTAGVSGNFTYSFAVSGAPDAEVPLIFTASGGVSQPMPQAANEAILFVGPTEIGYACLESRSNCPAGQNSSFAVAAPITVETNTEIVVDMLFSVVAFSNPDSLSPTAGDSQSAFIDPIISFAPGFDATSFTLDFSAGVGNGPTATPLPASLPLFGSGLAAIGIFQSRRNQKRRQRDW